jgi:hypothetical protein
MTDEKDTTKGGVPEEFPYVVGDTPIVHNGLRYEPGQTIMLTDMEALHLGPRVQPVPTKGGSRK